MHAEYRWIFAELEADVAVRAVVVTGTPPAFCVGGDRQALGWPRRAGRYDPGLPDEPASPATAYGPSSTTTSSGTTRCACP